MTGAHSYFYLPSPFAFGDRQFASINTSSESNKAQLSDGVYFVLFKASVDIADFAAQKEVQIYLFFLFFKANGVCGLPTDVIKWAQSVPLEIL